MGVRLAVVGLILAMSPGNCANYEKQGMNEADWRRDSYECERDARQAAFRASIIGAIAEQMFFERCLEARGYKKAP
jgi:hypothetical protein